MQTTAVGVALQTLDCILTIRLLEKLFKQDTYYTDFFDSITLDIIYTMGVFSRVKQALDWVFYRQVFYRVTQ